MFVNLRPGEWIRVGNATLVVLAIKGSRATFALEGADRVCDLDGKVDSKVLARKDLTPRHSPD